MRKLLLFASFCTVIHTSGLKAQSEENFDMAQNAYSQHEYKQAENNYSRYIQSFDAKLDGYVKTRTAYESATAFEKTSKYSGFTYNHKWAVAYYQRGMCYLQLGESDKALQDFETSVKVDPNYGEPYYQKGIMIKDKDKTQGCYYISKACALGDTMKDVKAAYRDNFCWMCGIEAAVKGKSQIDMKEYREGIENINKAIDFCYDSATYYAYRGIAYEGLGKMDSALADYTTAIKIDTNSYMGYYRRGLTYDAAQRYKEAFDDYSRVIALNSQFADGYLHQAEDCENLGLESSEIYDYQQALKWNPNAGMAWYKLGLHKVKMGQDACDYFLKAADLGVDDAQSYADDCKAKAARKSLK